MSVFGGPASGRGSRRSPRQELLDGVEGPAATWLSEDSEDLELAADDRDRGETPHSGGRRTAMIAAVAGLLVGAMVTFIVTQTVSERAAERKVAVVLASPGAESAVLSLAERPDRDHPVVDVALRLHNRGAPVTFESLSSRAAAIDVRSARVVSGSTTIASGSSALLTVALAVTCPSDDNDSSVTLQLRNAADESVEVPTDLPEGLVRSARSYACLGVPGPVGGVSVRYATGVAQLPATVVLRLDVHSASDAPVWVVEGASSGLDDVTVQGTPIRVSPGQTARVTAVVKLEACPLQSGVAPPQLTLRVTATPPVHGRVTDAFDIRVPSDLPLITTYLQAAEETCLRRAQQ
ncbi:MAG: hypothetical protein ACTHK1_08120 [Actinomycetales bacterium]